MVLKLMSEFKLDEALKELSTWSLETEAQRQEFHLLSAKIYILKGMSTLAEESLKKYQEANGSKEKFFLEKLNLLYLAGNFGRWRATLSQSIQQLGIESELSFSDLPVHEQISFAKHLEEAGLITEVLEFYESLLKLNLRDKDYLRISAQLVRIQALWNIKGPLATTYNQLVLLSKKEFDINFFIEVQHALILAEAALFDIDKGYARLKETLSGDLDLFDRKQLLFDFSEAVISRGGELPELNLSEVSGGQLDSYELELKKLIQGQATLKIGPMDLPASSFFRLLVVAGRCDAAIPKATIEAVNFLLTDQFSTKTTRFWKSKLQTLLVDSQSEQTVHILKDGSVKTENKSYSFAKQASLKALLEQLAQGTTSLDKLCEVLFKESPSVSLYDRLRVNINRLNRTFEEELGIAKPFKIREGHILTSLKFQT